MTHHKKNAEGILKLLTSGVFFGFLGFFGKRAYAAGITPTELLALRFLISGGFTLISMYFLHRSSIQFKLKDIFRLFLLGILGYATFASFYFQALTGLSASLTVLLLYTYPIFVALGGFFLFKENFYPRKLIALVISLVGTFFLVAGSWEIYSPIALLFGFGSALFYAIYILASRFWISHLNSLACAGVIQSAAGLFLFPFAFQSFSRPLEITFQHPVIVLGVALICSTLAISLFLSGLKLTTPTEASILSTSEPLTGVLVSYFLLEEALTFQQILGGCLVICGVIFIASRKRTRLSEPTS